MFKKKSSKGKSSSGYSLPGLLLRPGVKMAGGIFSLLAAALFGGVQISRRKKKKITESEIRMASSLVFMKLRDVCGQLREFQGWLKAQDFSQMDLDETRLRYAAMKNLYAEWTSHERMEEILGTVQYDPKIGISVSNGLHELRSLNILVETVLREEKLGTPEGDAQMTVVGEHLERAIEFFSYVNKDIETAR